MIRLFKVSFFFRTVTLVLLGLLSEVGCAQVNTADQTLRSLVRLSTVFGTCNGVLLNNSAEDGRQLVLTARHCFDENFTSALVTFGGLPWRPDPRISTTSWQTNEFEVLASSRDLDFALLELTEPIPDHILPFLAGWEAQGVSPLSTYGHTYSTEPLFYEDINRPGYRAVEAVTEIGGQPVENGAWWVRHWEQGYTELGSSGAPLFNQWSRVIGILSAGASSADKPENDFFSRFELIFNMDPIVAQVLAAGTSSISMAGTELAPYTKKTNYSDQSIALETVTPEMISEEFTFSNSNTIRGCYIPFDDIAPGDQVTIRVLQNEELLYESTVSATTHMVSAENFIPFDQSINVTGTIEMQVSTLGSAYYQLITGSSSAGTVGSLIQGQSFGIGLLTNREVEAPVMPNRYLVYPNPVFNNIFIEGLTADTPLRFVDFQGTQIFPKRTTDYKNRQVFNFENIASGIYFLRLPNSEIIRLFVD